MSGDDDRGDRDDRGDQDEIDELRKTAIELGFAERPTPESWGVSIDPPSLGSADDARERSQRERSQREPSARWQRLRVLVSRGRRGCLAAWTTRWTRGR